jgi:hypothetical protein
VAQIFKHKCIKLNCLNTYEDNDPDDYYCPTCNEARKAIASQIDKKLVGIPKEPMESDIAKYERLKTEQNGVWFVPYKLL